MRFEFADPNLIDDYVRAAEDRIRDFEERMRKVDPAYKIGDRVDLYGEIFEIVRYEREIGVPGYWLSKEGSEDLFIPIADEGRLQPVVD